MRALADDLGVGVMTIYGYVRNKEELYEAACELAFSELAAPPSGDGGWYDQVRATVTELYAVCRRHPHLVTIVLTDTKLRPGLFARRARILDALEGAGFPEPVALRALGALISLTIGFAVSVDSALRELPREVDNRGDLHSLADAREHYSAHLDDNAFTYGVELLIGGLRLDLAALTATPSAATAAPGNGGSDPTPPTAGGPAAAAETADR